MQKNDIINITIESYGAFGEGVAHVDDSVIFLPFAMKGEEVEAKILSVKKGIAYAKVLRVIKSSEKRREPICPDFTKCGGCDLQHIECDDQLQIKKEQVSNCLSRIAKIDFPEIGINRSKCELGCRNKLTLPFGIKDGLVVLGFYSERSHRVVEIKECPLGVETKRIIEIFTSWANANHLTVYNEESGKGVLRSISVRNHGDKFMFTLVASSQTVPHLDELCERLDREFNTPIFYLNINPDKTNVVLGKKNVHLLGEKRLSCSALGIEYELSPFSFAQVNDDVRDKLYLKVLSYISEGEVVIDAYSGAGLMSVLFAKKAGRVYGAEIVPDAVRDANYCAERNGVGAKIINRVGDCAKLIPEIVREIGETNKLSVVLDPPRKGCDEAVLKSVLGAKPQKIIYVSCNPATLARDLTVFKEEYAVKEVEIFDMFPNTKHVESVVCLTRRLDNELRERMN